MITIELKREDFYPWCKKLPLSLLKEYPTFLEVVDRERLKNERKIDKHDFYRADFIFFTDDDGTRKVLKDKEEIKFNKI